MSNETILVVDDETDIRDIVGEILSDEGYHVLTAENAAAARLLMEQNSVELALLDIWMPDTDGITLLKEWMNKDEAEQTEKPRTETQVVMLSGHGTVETAVEAIRFGAFDFLEKPLSTAKLLLTVERALKAGKLQQENRRLRKRLASVANPVGKSNAMAQLRSQITRIGSTESWVMIMGEPGSGKEVVARAIHNASKRNSQEFVDINLAASASENIPRLLFGSEDGGAIHPGCFDQARDGTLLLDKIGDLDTATQTMLVNALEERRFLRLGGTSPVDINVRIIAVTNKDLAQAVAENRFREDLYYRLNVIPIHVPPLREHIEDVPELVDFYVDRFVEFDGLQYRRFGTAALNRLRNHHWPGNIRELKNLVQRILIVSQNEEILPADVDTALGMTSAHKPGIYSESTFSANLRDARDNFERAYLTYHLRQLEGNMSELAQTVGMERTHLYRKLKALGINPKELKNT